MRRVLSRAVSASVLLLVGFVQSAWAYGLQVDYLYEWTVTFPFGVCGVLQHEGDTGCYMVWFGHILQLPFGAPLALLLVGLAILTLVLAVAFVLRRKKRVLLARDSAI